MLGASNTRSLLEVLVLEMESNLREINEELNIKEQETEPPNQPAKAVEPPGHLEEQEGNGGGRTVRSLAVKLICKVEI